MDYEPSEELLMTMDSFKFRHDENEDIYYKPSTNKYLTRTGLRVDLPNFNILKDKIWEFANDIKSENKGLKKYTIERIQKSWAECEREIFIDKGTSKLYRLTGSRRNSYGLLKTCSKIDFIEKYKYGF